MYEFLETSTNPIVLEYNDKYDKLSHEELFTLCEQGDPEALYEIGIRFCRGLDGEEVNAPAAKQFFEILLTKQRNARAIYWLAAMYFDGEFGEENKKICVECAEYGYKWGDVRCGELLGVIYKDGVFVEKDTDKAISLLKEAVDRGDLRASYHLGLLYKDMENYISAKYYLEKAQDEVVNSYFVLGLLYLDGLGVEQDLEKARDYFEKAREGNIASASYFLGELYLDQFGIGYDFEKGIMYLEEAASRGSEEAYSAISRAYIDKPASDIEREKNLKKAEEYLQKTSGLQKAIGYQSLGMAYMCSGLPDAAAKAMECFNKENETGDSSKADELERLGASKNANDQNNKPEPAKTDRSNSSQSGNKSSNPLEAASKKIKDIKSKVKTALVIIALLALFATVMDNKSKEARVVNRNENRSVQTEQTETSYPVETTEEETSDIQFGDENVQNIDEVLGENQWNDNDNSWLEEFGIYADTVENYEDNLNPDYYRFYDAGITDFNFRYPAGLFNYVSKNTESFEDEYGTNVETIRFTGSKGAECIYSLSRRHDGLDLEQATGKVHTHEFNSLVDASDILVSSTEDHGKVIVTGWTSDGRPVYDLTKIEGDYVLRMNIILSQYISDEDKNYKGYIFENLYRLCGFADSKYSPRSYQEYLEANQ